MACATEFHIGDVRIAPNVILAPMSGITDSVFRRTIKEANPGAVGLVVSELISVEALSRCHDKTRRMLRFAVAEQPMSIQLFGWEPERMAEAARIAADMGAAIIDINCGCPVPKVVKRGGGAELMRQSGRLVHALRAVRRAVSVPVTVKIRAGWDEASRNAVEIAQLVEREGAAMVAVHGRTRAQLYTGACDWDLIAQVKAAVRIPVIGSGDIDSAAAAVRRLHETGVDGVMIGRATLSNPWLFQQIASVRAGRPALEPSPAEVRDLLINMLDRLATEVHPGAAIGRARGLICRMTRGVRDSAPLRQLVHHAPSIAAMIELLGNVADVPALSTWAA